jgi:FRG domain
MSKPRTEYTATDVPEYLAIVDRCTQEWFQENTWGPWFRGQSNAKWSLTPGLYRRPPWKRGIRILEDEIRQEFIVRAPSLAPQRPRNSWEWYFLMQHSGGPTRLLDWTESALIALYFAVKGKGTPDEKEKTDAGVWILEPWKLNEHVAGVNEVIAPSAEAGLVTKHGCVYRRWLPDRYSEQGLQEKLPVAVYPTHFSRRISSQRSCFTVHGTDIDGFENLPESFSEYLRKVIIPHDKAHAVETSLSVAGIDEVTIFPDLDGLGRWLAAILRDESAQKPSEER